MARDEWNAGWIRCIGMKLNGRTLDDVDAYGQPLRDDSFLMLLNPHHESIKFYLPKPRAGAKWQLCLDTRDEGESDAPTICENCPYELAPRTFALLKEQLEKGGGSSA
jgi:glycogen operon protein